MIVHIVMFTFKEENKEENIAQAKEMLLGLVEKIEVLISMEVGINFDTAERAMDLSLYSKFATKEDLSTYATHPAHLEVVAFIKSVALESKVVDYTLE
ncbi:MAG: Dabb family protein [Campylobacterales bacterium]|nr:Dabb family protein [Campylobacterales bacterium]